MTGIVHPGEHERAGVLAREALAGTSFALEDLALEVVVAEVEDRVPELDTRAARE